MRYGVYLAPPPDSALWRFGSRILGRDAATGETVPGFAPTGRTLQQWRALTAEPRRYGFHATLKAPFHLREGFAQSQLEAAVAELAASLVAFEIAALHVSALKFAGGGFLALTPSHAPAALGALEARALRELDRFRRPPDEAELARRRPERLTARQRDHLAAWGYPYVLEDFRLHFTLSGAVDDPDALKPLLAEAFASAVEAPHFRVDALVLYAQAAGAEFLILRRFPFGAGAG